MTMPLSHSVFNHRETPLLAGNLKRRWTVFMNSLKSPLHTNMAASLIDESPDGT